LRVVTRNDGWWVGGGGVGGICGGCVGRIGTSAFILCWEDGGLRVVAAMTGDDGGWWVGGCVGRTGASARTEGWCGVKGNVIN